jgi:acyl-[acyl-carrier-protein] desaturase
VPPQYLIPVEEIWQPSDFLPNLKAIILEEVKDYAKYQKILPYDFWVAMVGDMITEEACQPMKTG